MLLPHQLARFQAERACRPSPELLSARRDALERSRSVPAPELPPVRAVLTDGRTVELEKDCDCALHAGPHWLHMDRLWRVLNRQLVSPDGKTEVQRHYGILGFSMEEAVRLDVKLRHMQRTGIARLIEDEGGAA